MKNITVHIIMLLSFLLCIELNGQEHHSASDNCFAQIDDTDSEMMLDNMTKGFDGHKMGKRRKEHRRKNKHYMFSKEDEEKVINEIKLRDPELSEVIIHMKNENPDRYKMVIGKLLRLEKMKGKNPQRYKILSEIEQEELEIQYLSQKFINSTNKSERATIKHKLSNKLNLLFDKKEKIKLEVIKNLEKKLLIHNEKYKKRQQNKSRIIENRLQDLLKEIDQNELRW